MVIEINIPIFSNSTNKFLGIFVILNFNHTHKANCPEKHNSQRPKGLANQGNFKSILSSIFKYHSKINPCFIKSTEIT